MPNSTIDWLGTTQLPSVFDSFDEVIAISSIVENVWLNLEKKDFFFELKLTTLQKDWEIYRKLLYSF